jgi:protein-S-isoprenylcysteine O-methyltransferase Ste14
MFRHVVPDPRIKIPEGYHVEHPNREKAGAKITKVIVCLLLLASAALVLIVTLGGGSKLEGAKVVQWGYIVIYCVMAFYVLRWNRGLLPIAAALAIVLGIFAAIAGPEWFDREKPGYASPDLPENVLGSVTLLIVPVQLLLIVAAMRGFAQAWNVEVEVPDGQHYNPAKHGPATA